MNQAEGMTPAYPSTLGESIPITVRQQVQELYAHHHGWLFSLLRRRLDCAADAADLAQDAFMRLLVRPREFDSDSGARAYLGAVAKGLCIDLWRRRDIERAWLEALAAHPQAVEPSLEHRAMILETLWQVDSLLRKLPANVADAFILSRISGLTYGEIAIELKVSERMVKKYMARAMFQFVLMEAGLEAAAL